MKKIEYLNNEIQIIKTSIEPYKTKYITSNLKPLYHLSTTLVGLFTSIYYTNQYPIVIPFISCFSLRLFIIFHDSCHNSFFNNSNYNKYTSKLIEHMCLYSEKQWRSVHNEHHRVHGNLSEIDGTRTVLTLNKYNELSILKKSLYRLFRSPPIFFIISPIYVFWISQIQNLDYISKYIVWCSLIYLYGNQTLLMSYLVGQYSGSVMGVMLFHLQHQVNEGYWMKFNNNDKRIWEKAQLHGSSLLEIPYFLKYFTLGIEYHHIHHLTTQIPCYNLQECHENNIDKFNKITKVGYKQSLLSLFHTLYDEINKKYISFPLAKFFGLEY